MGNLNNLIRKKKLMNDFKIKVGLMNFYNDRFMRDYIIKTIQQRLYFLGQTADNRFLRTDLAYGQNVYARRTIKIKRDNRPPDPTNRVTLKDTGNFYKSFSINANIKAVNTNANFFKHDKELSKMVHIFDNFFIFSKNNKKAFIDNILSMTLNEKLRLKSNFVVPSLIKFLRKNNG
jgi:hypothetical protein